MKSIILVFVITVLFLIGMTKFTNDTNFNEALRYASLSNYYNSINKLSYDEGEVLWEGKPFQPLSENIGYLAEERGLYPNLS